MTYCVVIQQHLRTDTCPVPEANCVWRHRLTGKCMYSDKITGGSPDELARVVGAKAPAPDEVIVIKAKIKQAVTKEFSN